MDVNSVLALTHSSTVLPYWKYADCHGTYSSPDYRDYQSMGAFRMVGLEGRIVLCRIACIEYYSYDFFVCVKV